MKGHKQMNGKVAKRLRREAEKLSISDKPKLIMRLGKIWDGKVDEQGKKIIKTVAGTIRHAEGTTRAIYKKLKNTRTQAND